jgi:hypothetical protein
MAMSEVSLLEKNLASLSLGEGYELLLFEFGWAMMQLNKADGFVVGLPR